MSKDLNKLYQPNKTEDKIYEFWKSSGYFKASANSHKKPYAMVIPPPNITGNLHIGHALDETIQDILIRFKRMKGYNSLLVPGTDHAAIATEVKIVESMRAEGLTKEDLGREKFLERAFLWKEKYGTAITSQIKKLGVSCDWDRERFTMDEGCSKAVKEFFVRLYEKGLIYKGERIINWCPKCKTSISDAEVEFNEKEGKFWHIKYPLTDKSGFIEIATTRPETMLGDTAVAVNPNDDRYKHLIGKTVTLPLVNRDIPIIADEYVEMDFGTGAVKITPAHDPNDFEVGLRHNLPVINVMDELAVMNQESGIYEGLERYEARQQIVADLEKEGFLCKVESTKHNVGACYRCHETIEPRISMQWFVKMEPLAKPAIDAVKNGDTKFVPARFDKIYFNWLENIKDWCISRQLWWGHRIPAYYCKDCGEIIVSRDDVTTCKKCGSGNVVQDEDTLDTWFSSALWPFSVFGWPDKTEDFDYFYPIATMVTGYDIIFFWVVRMMFSALENTGKAPFDTVLIHGLVRDAQGRKMSKSLGNGIDPMEIIEKYGADALRFALAVGLSAGNDMRFSEEKVNSSRNFVNKIWNAARFILMNIEGFDVKNEIPQNLEVEDKWILTKLNNIVFEVTNNIEKLELGLAIQKLYDFIWGDFCDWYIEFSKIRLQNEKTSEITAKNTRSMLVYVMSETLKLLHPFMPFVTEEIWQSLPHEGDSIMISDYPEFNENYCFEDDKDDMEIVMKAIRAIRNRRAEMNVPQSKKAKIYIATDKNLIFETAKLFIEKLAYSNEVKVCETFDLKDAVTIVLPEATIYIPMDELIDKKAELLRLEKELNDANKQFEQIKARLENVGFISNAPDGVIENVKMNYEKLNTKINSLKQTISDL